MKKRLFLYTISIIFIGFLSFFFLSVYITYNNNLNTAKNTVTETTKIFADLYGDNIDISSFAKAGDETRITVISSDGTVLADTRPLDMNALENHLSRPEIQAALNDNPTPYTRYSETLGINFIYYALKVKSGDSYVFIRTAIPVAKTDAYLYQSLPLLIFLFIAVTLFCFLFIRMIINRTTKPFESIEQKLRSLSDGEYSAGEIDGSYEEINIITRNIDEIALILQNSLNNLHAEKNKLTYILNNIGDGIFVVDENKNITLINRTALDIFGVTPDISNKNINYLISDKTLAGAVENCVDSATDVLFETVLHGSIYIVAIKQFPDTNLTMSVLTNVTESRENAKRREEFFANASHELKTPLTAIKGFNELTAINNKDDSLNKYINGITRETDRMLSLIGDMLKLSELENTRDIKPVSVSLLKTVNEVREVLSAVINEKSINFDISGDAVITAEPGHIYELVKNLIENAVRYNNQNGSVLIKVENEKKTARLIISDSGIGISPEEQTRIFERFYRVEKSRSQRNGGTGLGLSIVKHICALYDWKLSLKSKPGIGTEITVIFDIIK